MSRIEFYLPEQRPEAHTFGAATMGFAGKPADTARCAFPQEPHGAVVHGTYEACLKNLPRGTAQAAVAMLGNAGGENAFIDALSQTLGCPVVGGGAAMDGSRGGLVNPCGEASVFILDDDAYAVETEVKNIHTNILGACEVGFRDPRVIDSIDGEDPRAWLKRSKAALGFAETDFEHFTLSDEEGVNAHLSWDGRNIVSGRDLCRRMLARYVKPEDVFGAVFPFYDDADAIVFGCAGLKAITGELPAVRSLGLYLFGEVCAVGEKAVFGNLMLSKLKLARRAR